MAKELIPINSIENRIFTIRGKKVMIDRDLAELYGIPTFRLNEAVKRNIKRFPNDFMFKLTDEEHKEVIANCDNLQNLKYSPSTPYAFTEQGVAMLVIVLNSPKAIEINIQIMRTFVKLRHFVLSQTGKNEQIAELRKLLMLHIDNSDSRLKEHDEAIEQIFRVLNNLIEKPKETKKIGFRTDGE
jgi:phage regulator Rha-like protein